MEILLHYSEKSSKRAKQHKSTTYYDPQSAGINLQSPQSDSTPWTPLTLEQVVDFLEINKRVGLNKGMQEGFFFTQQLGENQVLKR